MYNDPELSPPLCIEDVDGEELTINNALNLHYFADGKRCLHCGWTRKAILEDPFFKP